MENLNKQVLPLWEWLRSRNEEVTLIYINYNIIVQSINVFLEWNQGPHTNLQHWNFNLTFEHGDDSGNFTTDFNGSGISQIGYGFISHIIH